MQSLFILMSLFYRDGIWGRSNNMIKRWTSFIYVPCEIELLLVYVSFFLKTLCIGKCPLEIIILFFKLFSLLDLQNLFPKAPEPHIQFFCFYSILYKLYMLWWCRDHLTMWVYYGIQGNTTTLQQNNKNTSRWSF